MRMCKTPKCSPPALNHADREFEQTGKETISNHVTPKDREQMASLVNSTKHVTVN